METPVTWSICAHVNKYCMRSYPPPPISLQNIETKGTEKILPRKILQPKELDTKILYSKDLREKI